MEKSNKLNECDYGYLRRLSIDKLLELLALAPALSDKPEDEAYMDALEEAIIEKENENPTGFFPDVDQQWEQFAAHYLPSETDTALEPERTEHPVSAQANQQSLTVPPKRVVRFKRVWRTALVAAVAIACMFAILVTAQAAGVDVFGAMARWTEDVFSFGQIAPDSQVSDDPAQETVGQGAEVSSAEFASLQEAFDAYGMTEVHEPGWLPKGYALNGIDVLCVNDPFLQSFVVTYSDGERYINLDILSYEGEPITQVQKTDSPVESVEKNGMMFYHIENSVGRTIAWYSNQYEYYLSSDEGDDLLWKVVDSMFE